MNEEKQKISEAYKEMLSILEARGYYQGLYKPSFIGVKVEKMFLDHRDDLDLTDKSLIQMEKNNHYKAMAKLEKGVLDALAKMDNRDKFWTKFLKSKGL